MNMTAREAITSAKGRLVLEYQRRLVITSTLCNYQHWKQSPVKARHTLRRCVIFIDGILDLNVCKSCIPRVDYGDGVYQTHGFEDRISLINLS